jgi:azurin
VFCVAGGRARLVVDGLRLGYIHEIQMSGVRSENGQPLLHDVAYYTLNRIPVGERVAIKAAEPAPARQAARPTPAREAASLARRQTSMPAEWNGRVDATITIGTEPGMRFDVTQFRVKAGSRVRLDFNNQDDMLHNLLVVRPGREEQVARAALDLGLEGLQREYVPPSDDVLFHTGLLQPGTSETIYFVAPETPGDYPYLCTFPGHAATMRGTMTVVP